MRQEADISLIVGRPDSVIGKAIVPTSRRAQRPTRGRSTYAGMEHLRREGASCHMKTARSGMNRKVWPEKIREGSTVECETSVLGVRNVVLR